MALTLTGIRLLARSNARQPFSGPILTLGRQGIYATLDQCRAAIAAEGGKPHPVPEDVPLHPNVPAMGEGSTRGFTNDMALFYSLCGELAETLDVSDYEKADYIHDLNLPIPEHLKGRFGLIIDGGTLEHVFDIRQALETLRQMLRPGGRIIHMNPMNNWSEHGYYQFGPTFYNDYYLANGFAVVECLVIGVSRLSAESTYHRPSRVWRWHPSRPSAQIVSSEMLTTFFEAEKRADGDEVIPQQGQGAGDASVSQLGGADAQEHSLNRWKRRLMSVVPSSGWLIVVGKKLLGRDFSSRPWGMEYLGRY